MGWFGSLFRKKEIETAEIKFSDVHQWMQSRISGNVDSLNLELGRNFDELRHTVSSVRNSLENLENADITYKGHIDSRVKSVVLGHRKNYLRMAGIFLNSIEFPEEINYITASKFCSRTADSLNKFSYESAKTFYAVQHLFYKEVEQIAKSFKEFDRVIKLIKTNLDESGLGFVKEINSRLKDAEKEIKKKDDIAKEISELKSKLAKAKSSRTEFVKRMDELKKSKGFAEYDALKKENEKINSQINNSSSEIVQLFSPIEQALRKFEKIALNDEMVVSDYLDSFVKAFEKDRDFLIIKALQAMKNSINAGSLELKDKKKDKTLKIIDSIDEKLLKKIADSRKQLFSRKTEIEQEIKSNKSMDFFKEAEYKAEHSTMQIEKLKSDIEENENLAEASEKENQKIISEIEEMINKITKINAKIS